MTNLENSANKKGFKFRS